MDFLDIVNIRPSLSESKADNDKLKLSCGTFIKVNQINLAIVRDQDKRYIFENRCPHKGKQQQQQQHNTTQHNTKQNKTKNKTNKIKRNKPLSSFVSNHKKSKNC